MNFADILIKNVSIGESFILIGIYQEVVKYIYKHYKITYPMTLRKLPITVK